MNDQQYTPTNDACYTSLVKAKAIATCLLSIDIRSLPNSTLFDALWCIDDYLDELLKIHFQQQRNFNTYKNSD